MKSSKRDLLKRINTLELVSETQEETIKSELYKIFMNKLEEPTELSRLKSENKKLRNKNKMLKEMLNEK